MIRCITEGTQRINPAVTSLRVEGLWGSFQRWVGLGQQSRGKAWLPEGTLGAKARGRNGGHVQGPACRLEELEAKMQL